MSSSHYPAHTSPGTQAPRKPNSPAEEHFGRTQEYVADSTVTYQGEGDPSPEFDDGFPAFDDLTGRLLGQYRMGPVIGRGSMARVYQAEHH